MLRRRQVWPTVAVCLLACSLIGCTPATPAAPTSAPPATTAPKPATSPAPAVSPATSPVAVASPSPSPVASPSPAALNPVAPRPANASIRITAPTAGQSVAAGAVQVRIDYTGPTLVPAASSTKLDDYHVHYFLDESPAPYLGTTVFVPAGNPLIVHTADTQVTFENVAAGSHTVTVMLTGNNHISVNPPVSDQVTFTVR